jgi:hypothetical protein
MTSGVIAALYLVLSLLNSMIALATGGMGFDVFTGMVLASFFSAFTCLATRRFGALSLMVIIYGILALPFGIAGPPGFVPKLLVFIPAGIVSDVVYWLLKHRERSAAVLVGGLTSFLRNLLGFVLFVYLFPEIQRAIYPTSMSLIAAGLVGFLFIGFAGGYLAWVVVNRMTGYSPFLRRLRGE